MVEHAAYCKNVRFVDSSASNHMTSHGEWLGDVKNLEKPGNDTTHPIA